MSAARKLWWPEEQVERPRLYIPSPQPFAQPAPSRRQPRIWRAPRSAIAYVQTTGLAASSAATSLQTLSFGTNPTVGNYIVAWAWGMAGLSDNITTAAFTDTAGNSYSVPGAALAIYFNRYWAACGYAKVTTSGSNFKVTCTPSTTSGTSICVIAAEFSGVAATSPLDGTPNNNINFGAQTLSISTSNMTISNGSLVVAVSYVNNGFSTNTLSITPVAYTKLASENSSPYPFGGAAYAISPSSPTSQTWTASNNSYWLASQFALKAATGKLFRVSNLSGLGAGGPFFQNPLGG